MSKPPTTPANSEGSMSSLRPDETPAVCIERLAMRKLTLETSLACHLSKCNDQSRCPLFAKLPKEIRDMILEYATEQYEDLTKAYPENAYYDWPGYRGPHKTSTSILQTCRRLWLEANALPMRQAALTFWFEYNHGSTRKPTYDIGSKWTKLNKDNFTTLHLFIQKRRLFWMFRRSGAVPDLLGRLQPKVLRVTVRHTDMERLEGPLPVSLESAWLQNALDAPYMSSVHTLRVEVGVLNEYKDQLNPIIQHFFRLRGKALPLANGTHAQLTPSPDDFYTWRWTRRTVVDNKVRLAHLDSADLHYHVAVLTWKAVPCSADARGTVVTDVTFSSPRLRFPTHHAMRRRPPTMSDHGLRLQLLQGGWDGCQFPFANCMVRKSDVENATGTRDEMRLSFRRMFADVEARRLEKKWREEGSLLKFEEA